MIKIVALNDDEEVGDSEQEEIVATKEAQEAIAESEYVRAIKLKAEGNTEAALSLLNELLETQVLNEDKNNNKMVFIKYNCHKNIGLILEEKKEYEGALQNYISAMLIDNTDIFTLHKFGQLALKLSSMDLAEYAFEKCLAINAQHWKAADGLLMSLNRNCNLIRSYNYASNLCTTDPRHREALEVVSDIGMWFKTNQAVLKLAQPGHEINNNNDCCEKELKRIFKCANNKHTYDSGNSALDTVIDFQNLLVEHLNWKSIGQFILNLRQHMEANDICLFTQFNFEDIMKKTSPNNASSSTEREDQQHECNNDGKETADVEAATDGGIDQNKVAVESSEVQNMDSNNDDSDSNAKGESTETTKNKARRRCSDLHFLEQWGWHKNRRYSSRKKPDKEEPDDSLNSYLRRTFSKYMQEIAVSNWPFGDAAANEKEGKESGSQCVNCPNSPTEEEFQTLTQTEFNAFLKGLQENKTDLMQMIYMWLKSMSMFWNVPMPESLKLLYIQLFDLYLLHFDLTSCNQLPVDDFMIAYRICLLFLEMTAGREVFEDKNWKNVFYYLSFNIGACKMESNESTNYFEIRLCYIKYLLCASKSQYDGCLKCLDEIEEMLKNINRTDLVLHLPHSGGYCLSVELIGNMKAQYKSQIDICNLSKLYENQKWSQLVEVIVNNMEQHTNNNSESDNWLKDIQTILEILLQALWKLNSFDSCLAWCEKCLHYGVVNYLSDENSKSNSRLKMVASFINYVTSYIEALILNEGHAIVLSLPSESLCRMVQNLIRLVVYQFDGNFEKNNSHGADLDFKPLWSILHQLALRDEAARDESNTTEEAPATDDLLPASFQILFTAHEYLGRRHWCSNDNGEFLQYILDAVVNNFRAPLYDSCRDVMYEYIEQITYCLFKYPQRKARSKYLEDHDAAPIKLNWSRAVQIFDIYKPEQLPEFNSYKLESITSDMEQMLIKIVSLVPREVDPTQGNHKVVNYIEGVSSEHPAQMEDFSFPYKISNLYYLLADYYFKSRDFPKAIKFYTLDLVISPSRFDSWAGVALSKASQIETKLNGLDQINLESLWKECEQVIRCFECCITLDRFQTLLWIEYGSFCYTLQSFFSRRLRCKSENEESLAELEAKKLKLLNIAHNCFTITNSIQNSTAEDQNADSNDEKWLCQYMLGKISEKRKEDPRVYINNYLSAANYLYESNATYPIKVNHSNPTTLSVEALEVFYRINASIIKYISREKAISRSNGDLFNKVLKKLANSPFALNKAKIDGNLLKGKVNEKVQLTHHDNTAVVAPHLKEGQSNAASGVAAEPGVPREILPSLSRSSSTVSTVISTADSSSVDSDDDSDADTTIKNPTTNEATTTYTTDEIKPIYEMVVRNIEECITRFPEHYKSIYRLVYHFMNGPAELCSLEICEQLLMGQYKTSLGNIVNGLFYEKKNTNLFNGIWRIPSSEIDRPGSFSAHLVKCVRTLILLMLKTKNHKMLIEISLNLHKTPDADKRYIADADRKELCQLCITYCVEILRNVLEENQRQRNDQSLLNLLVDIYKIHKKCIKYMSQKESTFTKLLTDVYKFFIQDKVQNIPENCNFLDLAVKLCLQQLTLQKSENASLSCAMVTKSYNIPGLNLPTTTKQTNSSLPPRMEVNNFGHSEFNAPVGGFEASSLQKLLPLDFPGFTESKTADILLMQGYYANLLQKEQREQFANLKTSEIQNLLSSTQSLLNLNAMGDVQQQTMQILTKELQQQQQQTKSKSSWKNKTSQWKPYDRQQSSSSTTKYEENLHLQRLYNATQATKMESAAANEMLTDMRKNSSESAMKMSIDDYAAGPSSSAPTKTLQQKLVERQKTCQLKEISESLAHKEVAAADTSRDDDVIILD
ncbi:calcineurin-binding protein cabin-1-like [Musca autumnalis]|uniref:calcineurin-binding protein cabin-1-like n=1 Tax=Musca autumnalis TaxID=221902 RepID=UPI003CED7285